MSDSSISMDPSLSELEKEMSPSAVPEVTVFETKRGDGDDCEAIMSEYHPNNSRDDGCGWDLDTMEDEIHKDDEGMVVSGEDFEAMWDQVWDLTGPTMEAMATRLAMEMKEYLVADREIPELSLKKKEARDMSVGSQMIYTARFEDERLTGKVSVVTSVELVERLRHWMDRMKSKKGVLADAIVGIFAFELVPLLLALLIRERERDFVGSDAEVEAELGLLLDLLSLRGSSKEIHVFLMEFLARHSGIEQEVVFRQIGPEVVRTLSHVAAGTEKLTEALLVEIAEINLRFLNYLDVVSKLSLRARQWEFLDESGRLLEILQSRVRDSEDMPDQVLSGFFFSYLWHALFIAPENSASENDNGAQELDSQEVGSEVWFYGILKRTLGILDSLGWSNWVQLVVQDHFQDPLIEVIDRDDDRFINSLAGDRKPVKIKHWSPRNSAVFIYLSTLVFSERDSISSLLNPHLCFSVLLPYLIYLIGNGNPRFRQAGVEMAEKFIPKIFDESIEDLCLIFDGTMMNIFLGERPSIYILAKALCTTAASSPHSDQRRRCFELMKSLVQVIKPVHVRLRLVSNLLVDLARYLPLAALLIPMMKDCLMGASLLSESSQCFQLDRLLESTILQVLPQWLLPRKELMTCLDPVIAASSLVVFVVLKDQNPSDFSTETGRNWRRAILLQYLAPIREALAQGIAARANRDITVHREALTNGELPTAEEKEQAKELLQSADKAFRDALIAVSNLDLAIATLRKNPPL